jgi:uncharacterized protein DUF3306
MSETFLSRWSRRKREASIPPPQGEGGEDRRSEPGGGTSTSPRLRGEVGSRSDPGEGGSQQAQPAESPPHPDPLPASGEREFDPASLPPVESIDAGTDVSAFLRPDVPADLTQAALRRAWVTDPAIRDFVGPAENAWDFNAPGGVPGFEPLRAIDDVQRLAAQILGTLPVAPPETVPADGEETTGTVEAQPVSGQSPPETAPPADDAAMQNDQSAQKT